MKISKHYHYCLIVLITTLTITTFVSTNCFSQNEEPDWSYKIYEQGVRELMKALHQEWEKSDGAAVFDIGDKLFWALLLDPNGFYVEFSPDTVNFRRFSEDIDALVFVNSRDTTTSGLEHLKEGAIWRLELSTVVVEPKYVLLHQEMIETIRNVKVRFID